MACWNLGRSSLRIIHACHAVFPSRFFLWQRGPQKRVVLLSLLPLVHPPWPHPSCSAASGIPGCVFVHASGFIGGNDTLEGATAMAAKALEME